MVELRHPLDTHQQVRIRNHRTVDVFHDTGNHYTRRVADAQALPDRIVIAEHLTGKAFRNDRAIRIFQKPVAVAIEYLERKEAEKRRIRIYEIGSQLLVSIKNLFTLPLIRDDRTDFLDLRIPLFQPIGNRDTRFQKLFIADGNDPVVIRLLFVDIQFPFHIHRNQDHEHQRNRQPENVDRRVPLVPAQEFQKRFYI